MPASSSIAASPRFTAHELRFFTAFEIGQLVVAQFHVQPGANRMHRHLDSSFPAVDDAVVRVSLDGVEVSQGVRDGGDRYCFLPWPSILDIRQQHAHAQPEPDQRVARMISAHSQATTVAMQCREGTLRVILLKGELAVSALLKAVQHCASASEALGADGTLDGEVTEPVLGPAATGSPTRAGAPHGHKRGAAPSSSPFDRPVASDEHALLGMRMESPPPTASNGGHVPPLTRAAADAYMSHSPPRGGHGLSGGRVAEADRKLQELRAQSEAMRADIRPDALRSTSRSAPRSVTPSERRAPSERSSVADDRRRQRAAAARRSGMPGSRSSSATDRGQFERPDHQHHSHEDEPSRPPLFPHGAHHHDDHHHHDDVDTARHPEHRQLARSVEEHQRHIAEGDSLIAKYRRQLEDDAIALAASPPRTASSDDVSGAKRIAAAANPATGGAASPSSLELVGSIRRPGTATDASPFISPGTPDRGSHGRRAVDDSASLARAWRDDIMTSLDSIDRLPGASTATATRDNPSSDVPSVAGVPPAAATAAAPAPVASAATVAAVEEVQPQPAASAPVASNAPVQTASAPGSVDSAHVVERRPPAPEGQAAVEDVVKPGPSEAATSATPAADDAAAPAASSPAVEAPPPSSQRSSADARVREPQSSAPAAATKPEKLRTDGDWRELWSDEKKKVYFYNSATKKTTWDIKDTPFDVTSSGAAASPKPSADSASPTAATKPEKLRTDGDWRELWSDEKKKVYFYNSATQKTTWNIKDTPFADRAAEATAASPGEAAPAKKPEKLRTHGSWRELWDEKKGSVYYYNAFNKKVTRNIGETPFGALDESEEGGKKAAGTEKPQTTQAAKQVPQPVKAPPQVAEAKSAPPPATKSAPPPPVKTSAPPPVSPAKAAPPPAVTAPPPAVKAPPPPVKAPPPLMKAPPPPVKALPAAPAASGETSAAAPVHVADLKGKLPPPTAPIPDVPAAKVPTRSSPLTPAPAPATAAKAAGTPSDTPTSPPEVGDRCGPWLVKKDDKTGKVYFKDTVNKKTTWLVADTPWARVAQAAAGGSDNTANTKGTANDNDDDVSKPVKKGDWVRKFDKGSNRFYFKNSVTGERQWSPAGTPFEAEARAAQQQRAGAPAGASSDDVAAHAPVVIDGWKRLWNAAKKKHYYVNLATKESTYKVAGTPFENMPAA